MICIQIFKSNKFKLDIQTFSTSQGINWSFIPPSSSHFGGLWESTIKSVQYHMHQVIGQTILNLVETSFIEACLINSCPISAISTDHRDP